MQREKMITAWTLIRPRQAVTNPAPRIKMERRTNMKTYFVLLDGWIMSLSRIPEKCNFREDARLFEANCNTVIDFLPDWFGRGFNHNKFKEITNTWE